MPRESKRDNSMFSRQPSFGDEDYDMEKERLPSSLSSSLMGEMNSLDLLSSQEIDLSTITDDEDDPKVAAKQPPPNAEDNVKSSDAAPSHAVGSGPSSNATKVSSFSVLSKTA